MNYFEKIEQFAKIEYSRHDDFHQWSHVEDVLEVALHLASFYTEVDLEILKIAVIFHDITYENYDTHVDKSVETTKKFLEEIQYPEKKIKKIVEVIYDHSWPHRKKNWEAKTIEWKIIYDSDKFWLVMLNEDWYKKYFPQLYLQETRELVNSKKQAK